MARKPKSTTSSGRKPKGTPSYVVELPLRTSAEDERRLNDRFSCGARLNNVVLQDGINIVQTMRDDPEWASARTIKDIDKRRDAFKAVRIKHHFSSAAFDRLVARHARAAGFYGRIGTHEMQAIASRVFDALNKWVLGRSGRPRFKGRKRALHSIEGKNNTGMLQWKAESKALQVEAGWQIGVILPNLDKNEWLWSALQARTKYCRLVWRRLHGVKRWYVQLVQEGLVPVKAKLLERLAPEGCVGGLDLGPSTVAWCTQDDAGLLPLCPEIDRPEKAIRRTQRHIDRMRRAGNPANYKADGSIRKGKKEWTASGRQKRAESVLANLQRKEAATRRKSHGQMTNLFLTKARKWKDDGVSPKALQRIYGKSVGKRAPGMLMSELERKAERAGGQRMIIDSRNLKTSQYDHATDSFKKKKLSQRWHEFGDGRGKVQRDVYSAFLALHVEGNEHSPSRLETAWAALESALCEAGLCEVQGAREGYADPRRDFARRQSASPVILKGPGLKVEKVSTRPGANPPESSPFTGR